MRAYLCWAAGRERGGSPAAYVSRWCTLVTPVPVRSCESHEHAMSARDRLSLLHRYDWRWYNNKYYCTKKKLYRWPGRKTGSLIPQPIYLTEPVRVGLGWVGVPLRPNSGVSVAATA